MSPTARSSHPLKSHPALRRPAIWFLVCTILTTALAPRSLAESAVWKASKGGNVVYLAGTCHVLRPQDFPLPAEFDTAFRASTRIFFETDIARMSSPEMQRRVEQEGRFQDGRTLENQLTPAAWKLARDYAEKAGLPAEHVRTFKPWFFILMLMGIELSKIGVTQDGVDAYFHREALKSRKPTGELESFESQFGFMINLGKGQESRMIESTIADLRELPAIFESMIAAWRGGNLSKLDELMLADMRREFPEMFRELIVMRNNAWMPKIAELLDSPETEMILVGVAHLAGPEGLLDLLRAKGCAIEQIEAR